MHPPIDQRSVLQRLGTRLSLSFRKRDDGKEREDADDRVCVVKTHCYLDLSTLGLDNNYVLCTRKMRKTFSTNLIFLLPISSSL